MRSTRPLTFLANQFQRPSQQTSRAAFNLTRRNLSSRPSFSPFLQPIRNTSLTSSSPSARPVYRTFRWNSSDAPAPPSNPARPPPEDPAQGKEEQPAYELTFTCKPCSTRSSHRISKQGYHKGTVLITCPSCKNRHVIADHLKIFGEEAMTIEDLMQKKGDLVKKGSLSADGDVEFWEDGTSTQRKKSEEP
ncbi:MAG: hypothetical protein M1819_002427 [Sarea resinae]|nr:MAG: hypothetical protein M1819_002427 [Sarea resinae]